jgi:hypothetical protein
MNLTCNNDANRTFIAAKGGIEAIVSAMTAHSNVSKVQEWGCFTLANLARNDANRVWRNIVLRPLWVPC